jgi:RimJ/RimL family protein N-acetyltransferase
MMPALAPTPVLNTQRLVLRAPVAGDWPAWRAFMASDRAAFVRAPDLDDAKSWRAFGHFIGHWVLRGFGQFVVTDRATGQVLGSVGPWFPQGWPERELGWLIWDAAAEGRGIAEEALRAARDHAFAALGWDTAVSYIHPDNARSLALARRLGCTRDPDAAVPASQGGDAASQVWRHPAQPQDAQGGMEAYA